RVSVPRGAGAPPGYMMCVMRARHALVVLLAACGDAQSPGAAQPCGSEERVVLDCAAEVGHREAIEVPADPIEARAIERVNAQIAAGAATYDRTCSAYNACEIDLEAYRAETESIRARHAALPEMIEALKSDRPAALDAL